MLSWSMRCTRRSRLNSTFNTQVEAHKQNVCWGRLSISMESTPPLRLTFADLPYPPLTSPFVFLQTYREFSIPVAARTWTEPAQWGTVGTAHATHTCSVSGVRLVWHDHVSRRRFDMRPYANSFQIRTKQNKTKAGTVGYGLLRSFLLGFCLFMRTFCADRTFHILCELPARCFVYLHSHTHTLIAHHQHRLLPHLSTRLVLA